MKEYLIKYYLDDNEKNPFKDTEIEIINANNDIQAVEKLGLYLRRQIITNPFVKYKNVKYYVSFKHDKITLYLDNRKLSDRSIIETYIIESIEELR